MSAFLLVPEEGVIGELADRELEKLYKMTDMTDFS